MTNQRFGIPALTSIFLKESGSHLLSHAVSSIVPSAAYSLTVVFGMGTGVSRKRIATRIRDVIVSAADKDGPGGKLAFQNGLSLSDISGIAATERTLSSRCTYAHHFLEFATSANQQQYNPYLLSLERR